MKRMVTEEEIAEIASKNSKPLYRYNVDLTLEHEDDKIEVVFDVTTNKGLNVTEESTYNEIAKALILAIFAPLTSANFPAAMYQEGGDYYPCFVSFTVNVGTGYYAARLNYSGGNVDLVTQPATLDDIAAYLASGGFSITQINLNTDEVKYWEL